MPRGRSDQWPLADAISELKKNDRKTLTCFVGMRERKLKMKPHKKTISGSRKSVESPDEKQTELL